MKKAIAAGLVVLFAACGGQDEHRLTWGPAQQPTFAEQDAAATAQATLQGSLAFAASTEPSAGAMGLADQLVASLGGSMPTVGGPGDVKQLAGEGRAGALAFDTGGMDPACVTTTLTSATWSGCVIEMTETDPYTGDTTWMRVTVSGTLGSSAGVTRWDIAETFAMTMTSGGQQLVAASGTAKLLGELAVTDSTIVGYGGSILDITQSYMGFTMSAGLANTFNANLQYQADPFCITGGSLQVHQVWTQRPMGAPPAMYPDQGWLFSWSGCGVFTVAHGS